MSPIVKFIIDNIAMNYTDLQNMTGEGCFCKIYSVAEEGCKSDYLEEEAVLLVALFVIMVFLFLIVLIKLAYNHFVNTSPPLFIHRQ